MSLIKDIKHFRFIYTDGSKSLDGALGFSVFFGYSFDFKMYSVSNVLTIFDIELLAISYAIKHIGEEEPGMYAITSDSLSGLTAISTIDKRGNAHQMIYEIKENLRHLQSLALSDFTVLDTWILRHLGQ